MKSVEKNSFLNNSRCGYILGELHRRKEVQIFFKNIILEIIHKLETTYSSDNLLLNLNEINKLITKKKGVIISRDEEDSDVMDKLKQIGEKYLSEGITKNRLEALLDEHQDKTMKDYINKRLKDCQNAPKKYSNEFILQSANNLQKKGEVLLFYEQSFKQITEIIDILCDNLITNVDSLPYTIKCICKIILIFAQKKFNNAIKVEHNSFIAIFFFHTLFYPLLENPSFSTFINELIISESTKGKLQRTQIILNKMITGILFENNQYTPFNLYIIEKMPKMIEFLDKICQVNLPTFIDKFIKNNLPEDYKYYYFAENPGEMFLYRNICFNGELLSALIESAKQCQDKIEVDSKLFEKFEINKNVLDKLKNPIQRDGKQIVNNYLIINSIHNKAFDKMFNLKDYKDIHFKLKELKKGETEEDEKLNTIIKIKNFFYMFLYNYHQIFQNDFKPGTVKSIENVLKELKVKISNESAYTDIPLKWFVNSLLQYLPKLPEELKENDYELLFDEMHSEINNSLEDLDLKNLSVFLEYFKEIKKDLNTFEKIRQIIIDIDLNKRAEELFSSLTVSFSLQGKNSCEFFIKLMKEQKQFADLFTLSDGMMKNQINSFISHIPNLKLVAYNKNLNTFELIKQMKIPEIIENYFKIIYRNLQEKIIDKHTLESLYNKIYDYTMEQLYDKLFPKETLAIDDEIYQNSVKHIWVELQHLVKGKINYISDDYLPDSINHFQQFEREKSPRKKFIALREIFSCMVYLAAFNNDQVKDTDDEMILLNYSIIKAKLRRIYSNIQYAELFLGSDKQFGSESNQITKLKVVCEKIKDLKSTDFYHISESDYTWYCGLAEDGILC